MRIAINALSAVAGGGVTYLNQIFKHLSEIDNNNEYIIITTKRGEKILHADYKNFKVISYKIPSLFTVFRLLWEQLCLKCLLKRLKVNILYSPANIGLIFSSFPTIIAIQTVAPFDKDMIRKQNLYYRLKFNCLRILTNLSVRKAKKIIFITDKAKRELSEYYNLKEEKTALIYHGKSTLFKPNLDCEYLEKVKQKYNLNEIILYVSNIYRYKNFFELIQAFSLIKNQISPHIKLALVGRSFDDQYTESLKTLIISKEIKDRVIFFGHIPYEELPCFYTLCKIFVYPSTCESFGMTLVEAMSCGAPVLSSNIEPMTEICQEAAVYFDPFNPQDIAEKVKTVLTNDDLLQKLKEQSLKRSYYFSWEKTAKETLGVLQEFN